MSCSSWRDFIGFDFFFLLLVRTTWVICNVINLLHGLLVWGVGVISLSVVNPALVY